MGHISLSSLKKKMDPRNVFRPEQVKSVFGEDLVDRCGAISGCGFRGPLRNLGDWILLPDPGLPLRDISALFPDMFRDEDLQRYRPERFFARRESPTWRLLPRFGEFRDGYDGVSARSVVLAQVLFQKSRQQVLFRVPAVHTSDSDRDYFVIDVAFDGSRFEINDQLPESKLVMAPRPIL